MTKDTILIIALILGAGAAVLAVAAVVVSAVSGRANGDS